MNPYKWSLLWGYQQSLMMLPAIHATVISSCAKSFKELFSATKDITERNIFDLDRPGDSSPWLNKESPAVTLSFNREWGEISVKWFSGNFMGWLKAFLVTLQQNTMCLPHTRHIHLMLLTVVQNFMTYTSVSNYREDRWLLDNSQKNTFMSLKKLPWQLTSKIYLYEMRLLKNPLFWIPIMACLAL